MQTSSLTNLQVLRNDWDLPNHSVQSNLDALVYLLETAIEQEPSQDRIVWMKKSLKEVKTASTAMLRANSALNAATYQAA